MILNILLGMLALSALFLLWIGAHLLARLRLGERRLGCRGPTTDDEGNEICCHTGEICDAKEEGTCEGLQE